MNRGMATTALVVTLLCPSAIVESRPVTSPDFDGDGMVGFSDFVQFAGVFGSTLGDGRYQAKYDLDRDGMVGFSDFVVFAEDFGKSANQGTNPLPIIEAFCGEEDLLKSAGFVYTNNMWGKGEITDYEQCLLKCVDGAGTVYGWRWPLGNSNVKAYPEVIFGHKPLGHPPVPPTVSDLPKRISDINRLQVSYDVEMTARGLYNLAFEMWVTSDNPPTTDNITHEIMIWVDRTIAPATSDFLVAEVEIDGVTYDLYYVVSGNPAAGQDRYIAFSSRIRQLSGTLDFRKFLDYLIAHDYLPTDQYVTSVELGNEVIEGVGETWLKRYEVIVN